MRVSTTRATPGRRRVDVADAGAAPGGSGWRRARATTAPTSSGTASRRRDGRAATGWWAEPIFCGWGAQCARRGARAHLPAARTPPKRPGRRASRSRAIVRPAGRVRRVPRPARRARPRSGHDRDRRPLAGRVRHRRRSTPSSWPDLRGWIDARHAEGRKVLLWWKAWDPEGIPADECVVDAAGAAGDGRPREPRLPGAAGASSDRPALPRRPRRRRVQDRLHPARPERRDPHRPPGVWGIAATAPAAAHVAVAAARRRSRTPLADRATPCIRRSPTCSTWSGSTTCSERMTGRRVPVVDQLAFRPRSPPRACRSTSVDTDQWPMPDRAEWLALRRRRRRQLGVPALYYLESIDSSGEPIGPEHLALVARLVGAVPGARPMSAEQGSPVACGSSATPATCYLSAPGRRAPRSRSTSASGVVLDQLERPRHRPDHRRADDPPPPRPGAGPAARRRSTALRIHVPPVEVDLFDRVDEHLARPPARQRLQPAAGPVLAARAGAGARRTVPEYRTARVRRGSTSPAPDARPHHRLGDLPARPRRRRLAFVGDLIYAPGQGVVARRHAVDLRRHRRSGDGACSSCSSSLTSAPTLLLPSHGVR